MGLGAGGQSGRVRAPGAGGEKAWMLSSPDREKRLYLT